MPHPIKSIKHYRRFHGYDYNRGASIFVTFAVKGRLPDDEWWSGVGAVNLLGSERKISAVSISRSVSAADLSAVTERLFRAARTGWVIASTFISPGERALEQALEAERLPRIRAVPDALRMVYRPHVEDTRAFAEGRLVVISRECPPEVSRSAAWHGINDALFEMASVTGDGVGVYIHSKGPDGRRLSAPKWERKGETHL